MHTIDGPSLAAQRGSQGGFKVAGVKETHGSSAFLRVLHSPNRGVDASSHCRTAAAPGSVARGSVQAARWKRGSSTAPGIDAQPCEVRKKVEDESKASRCLDLGRWNFEGSGALTSGGP